MPVFPVAGSEKFANQPASREETLRAVGDSVRLHDVDRSVVDALDPLTYEVVRHRLTSITEEMGEALKRMSGSVVVTDCNDFDAAIMDEVGEVVQVGLYNTQLAASLDMAVNWTLRHRSRRPGIGPGDMFLCNDPWVGGGLHQNDVSLFAPLFVDGELFCWTGAVGLRRVIATLGRTTSSSSGSGSGVRLGTGRVGRGASAVGRRAGDGDAASSSSGGRLVLKR